MKKNIMMGIVLIVMLMLVVSGCSVEKIGDNPEDAMNSNLNYQG